MEAQKCRPVPCVASSFACQVHQLPGDGPCPLQVHPAQEAASLFHVRRNGSFRTALSQRSMLRGRSQADLLQIPVLTLFSVSASSAARSRRCMCRSATSAPSTAALFASCAGCEATAWTTVRISGVAITQRYTFFNKSCSLPGMKHNYSLPRPNRMWNSTATCTTRASSAAIAPDVDISSRTVARGSASIATPT